MKREIGITKVIVCLSTVLLVFLFIGYLIVPHDMNTTVNYCFSDKSELIEFGSKLNERNISFSQISDTTVRISKSNENQADNIFNQVIK